MGAIGGEDGQESERIWRLGRSAAQPEMRNESPKSQGAKQTNAIQETFGSHLFFVRIFVPAFGTSPRSGGAYLPKSK